MWRGENSMRDMIKKVWGGGVVYVRNKKKLNKIKHGLLKSGQTAINVYKNGDIFPRWRRSFVRKSHGNAHVMPMRASDWCSLSFHVKTKKKKPPCSKVDLCSLRLSVR